MLDSHHPRIEWHNLRGRCFGPGQAPETLQNIKNIPIYATQLT
jgi:hypothetical protein